MASKLHGTDVEVSVVQNKSDNGADHVQFLITEKKDCQKSEEMSGISADAFTMSNFPFLSKGNGKTLLLDIYFLYLNKATWESSVH